VKGRAEAERHISVRQGITLLGGERYTCFESSSPGEGPGDVDWSQWRRGVDTLEGGEERDDLTRKSRWIQGELTRGRKWQGDRPSFDRHQLGCDTRFVTNGKKNQTPDHSVSRE